MNVPLVVKVWIVFQPDVVIVHQVELGDTQLVQSVAYDIITTQSHHLPDTLLPESAMLRTHPPPPPSQLVPLVAGVSVQPAPAPPPQVHPAPLVAVVFPLPHQPPPYVTEAHDIELARPAPPAPPLEPDSATHIAHIPPHQAAATHHTLVAPAYHCEAVQPVHKLYVPHPQQPQFLAANQLYAPQPPQPYQVSVENTELLPVLPATPVHHTDVTAAPPVPTVIV